MITNYLQILHIGAENFLLKTAFLHLFLKEQKKPFTVCGFKCLICKSNTVLTCFQTCGKIMCFSSLHWFPTDLHSCLFGHSYEKHDLETFQGALCAEHTHVSAYIRSRLLENKSWGFQLEKQEENRWRATEHPTLCVMLHIFLLIYSCYCGTYRELVTVSHV